MNLNILIKSSKTLLAALLLCGIAPCAIAKPLKVFILAGQSNMQGHAAVSTFDYIGDDPATAPLLKKMRGTDGKPRSCDKVWISSIGCLGDAYSDLTEKSGKLTAGFGAPEDKIGPEFTFGMTMEARLKEPVLLIKTAWGGRSLITDFRPPGAGSRKFNDFILGQWKERGLDVEKESKDNNAKCGVYYIHMIEHVKKVLGDIKRVVPEHDPKEGYELAGFVWFQGFNDLVDNWSYPNQNKPGGYDEYGQLLAQLIRDVRKDLSAPKMPVVIGVMGIGGVKEDSKPGSQKIFREAQAAVAEIPEFNGNVAAVRTAPFWDDGLQLLQERMEACWPKVDARVAAEKDTSWENKMKLMAENFTPEEWKRLQRGVSNAGYHYLGCAKTFALIGQAFAETNLDLLNSGRGK